MSYINSCWLNAFVHLLEEFIIDHILTNFSSLTTTKKRHACRLYLQIILLLDITTLKDDTILTTSLQGIRDKNQSSAYAWPRQLETLEVNA